MTRVEGFYWVKLNGNWIVAEYNTGEWWITSSELPETYFDEIDENRITRETVSKIMNHEQQIRLDLGLYGPNVIPRAERRGFIHKKCPSESKLFGLL